MCAKHKETWGNIDCEWSILKSDLVRDAICRLHKVCNHLFKGDADAGSVEDVCRARLYQTRRNWQQKQRAKKRESCKYRDM